MIGWNRTTVALVCWFVVSVWGRAQGMTGRAGMVSTVRAEATQAGLAALREGGNAVDAAVAAGLILGVVDGYNSGIGGGCFMMIRLADGRFIAIDGRETAPGGATREMFIREGKADPALSQTGALAVGVPGALAAYEDAVTHFGRLTLSRHLLAAADLAEEGFRLGRTYARRLESVAAELARFEGARPVFFDADGKVLGEGDRLRQPDLASSYRWIAREGTGWFYGGRFASLTAEWMRNHGGLLTVQDFREYVARRREPIVTTYRGHQIVGFPPPSSGGVHVAQLLNMLEEYDLRSMGPGTASFIHQVAESMKRVFADRAYWLGDPDFADVPLGLISKEYARELARQIDPERATRVPRHGQPPDAERLRFGKQNRHTTHFSAADSEGNWVACTATINTTFGSKVMVPGTGIVLNNEMDDFAAQPGAANFFGLVGAEANSVAPGKRPLSSMSPTIVLRDGKPLLAVGAAGGPTIISQTLLAIVNFIDFGMDVESALRQSRFHHQWIPDTLMIEKSVGSEVMEELRNKGHELNPVNSFGAAQAVARDAAGGLTGAADPRGEGVADVTSW